MSRSVGWGWFVAVGGVTLASGWVGAGVDRLLGVPSSMESLGVLIWLITPLLLVLGVRLGRRTVSPGRWSPRLRLAWPWYLLALAVYPVLSLIVSGLGVATGAASLRGFDLRLLLAAGAGAFAFNIIKNVFEEAVWRGYFVGELDSRRWNDWAIYAVSGAVWGLWHLPYYLFFLPREQLAGVMDVPRGAFAAIAVLVMLAWSVLFAEVFRAARSIWPLVLLHAVEDVTINPLVLDGHLQIAAEAAWWLSPVLGVLPAGLLLILGLLVRRWRLTHPAAAGR